MKESPTLADAVMREWSRSIYRRVDANNWLVSHVAQARKFVLDNGMSAMMADLAYASLMTTHASPAKAQRLLDAMRVAARLPHKLTWIEYDGLARRQRARAAYNEAVNDNPENSPARSGWLLLQHPQLETAFMALHCASHSWNENKVRVAQPTVASFGYAWRSDTGPPPWPRDPVLNAGYPGRMPGGETVMVAPEGLMTGIVGYRSESVSVANGPHLTPEISRRLFTRQAYHPLREIGSDLRYLWALLATINDLPVASRAVRQDRGYVARGSYRRFCDHTVITLTVPAARYRRLAQRAIAHARRRAHEVRGHWRDDWRHPGARIWIREHQRGDATLGFVTHDYVVQPQ